MRPVRFLLPCVIAFAAVAAGPADEPLFKFNGKIYTAKDLPQADQQQLFDLKSEAWDRLATFADQEALNVYLDGEAKKAGKPRSVVEGDILGVPEPTDKQVQEWFEANKARIPPGYTLEKIAGEIKKGLVEQGKKEKRDALVAKLKQEGKITFLAPEPVAPEVKLDVAGFPVRGKSDAKVTVVEFADYQCPHCKAAAPILDGLVKKYDGKMKFVFMDYPIKGEFSERAAEGAFCAGEQGKFWEFHDAAYEKQHTLASNVAAETLAKDLKLDDAKFQSCMKGGAAKAHVAKAKAEGDRIGLTGTPSIYINGRRVRGYEAPDLDREIQRALKGGAS